MPIQSNSTINYDEQGVQSKNDPICEAKIGISNEHAEIHAGNHYTSQDYDNDVDVASPKYWLIIAPNTNTRLHFMFNTILSRNGLVEFFEAPTITDNGVAVNMYNSDRNSSNTPELLYYRDPTVSADGNRISVNVVGTDGTGVAGAEGGIRSRDDEIILKQNTAYLIKVTPANDNTRVSNCLRWYEE